MGVRHTAVIPIRLNAIRLLNSTASNSSSEGVLPRDVGDKINIWTQELYDSLQSAYVR